MFPLRDENASFLTPFGTWLLVAGNLLSWLLVQGLGSEPALSASVCEWGLIPGDLFGRLPVGSRIPMGPGLSCEIEGGHVLATPLTSMFLHGGWVHLIGNLWFLWVFGNNVEDALGRPRFLAFYLLTGIAAAATQTGAALVAGSRDLVIPMVGASGAISGVLAAYLVMFPRARVLTLIPIFILIRFVQLPASLFLVRPEHELAVFELGINRIGEMDILAAAYEPDCAIINNIGSAHIGMLGGTRQGIAAEKKKISSRFNGAQTLIVPEDDDFRDYLLSDVRGRGLCFGPRSQGGFGGARSLGLEGWELSYGGLSCRLALPGAHNLMNALAAIQAASLYGAAPEDVQKGLAAIRPLSGRSEFLRGRVSVVNDCYNANAESMFAAISFCDDAELSGRRIYVLGSMKELGDESPEAHRKLGLRAASSKADCLYFFGEEATAAYHAAKEASFPGALRHFTDFDALSAAFRRELREGDTVLLKASRSMALERLLDVIKDFGGTHVS